MISNYDSLITDSQKIEKELLTLLFMSASKEKIVRCLQMVSPKDFHHFPKHFEVIVKFGLYGKDYTDFSNELGITLTDAISQKLSYRNIEAVSTDLKNISKSIRASLSLSEYASRPSGDNVDSVLQDVQKEIAMLASEGTKETVEIKPIMEDYSKLQEEHRNNKKKYIGWETGFKKIDDAIDGVRAPHMWIIGGYTSTGKSSLALNIMLSLMKQDVKCVMYSLEMSKVDLVSRLLALMTREQGIKILKGLSSEAIEKGKADLSEMPLKLVNEKRNLQQIILSMNEQKLVWGAQVFFIDYLQQINVEGASSEYESMRETAIEMQKVAEYLNVPIIALSQVSNEAARLPNSAVMGFKGAGTIASAADFAIELIPNEADAETFRRKTMENIPVAVKAVIKKNRHGRTGTVGMTFFGSIGEFKEDKDDFDDFKEVINKEANDF